MSSGSFPSTSIGGGFTEGELKVASFWVRHQALLIKIVYGGLLTLSILCWGYALWVILDTYAISYPRESRFTQEITSNQLALASLEQDRPQNIQTSNVLVLPTTDSRFDMAIDLDNPNEQWWADFTYRFLLSGEQTPSRTGFIMPTSKTTITELGYSPKARGGAQAQFSVESIRWHRLDPKQVKNRYKEYENDHFNVAFENVKFDGTLVVGSKQVGVTSFDLINRGSYGYWSLDLVIKLYRGSTVIALNKINIQHLTPGETRHIDINWYDKLPAVTKTELIPVVNFLDSATYLPTEKF